MLLRKMKIGTRLAMGFGAVLAVMLVVSMGATALGQKSRHDLATILEGSRQKETLASDLKVLVRRLRRKLGDDGETPRYIQNEWGLGYRFVPPS